MTEEEYNRWLTDLSVQRVLLAELHYAGGIEYVSTAPYISKPTDSDPNRSYDDLLATAVDIATRIDGLIQFGEIALVDDGSITHWIPRAWQGHPIRLYLGGPEWSRDDFRLLAIGRNGGIREARFGEIVFEMDDESSVLDEPINTGELPDDMGPVPLALGSVYNVPAYRVESQTLTYHVSYLPVSSASAKDNGAAVSHSTDTAAGTVTLNQPLVGELSVDIEESHNTPAQIVEWVAAQYGIDVYEADMPDHAVGLYYNSEVSGREILDDLCEGLGAYWYINALGHLVVRQHTDPEEEETDITLVAGESSGGVGYISDALSGTGLPPAGSISKNPFTDNVLYALIDMQIGSHRTLLIVISGDLSGGEADRVRVWIDGEEATVPIHRAQYLEALDATQIEMRDPNMEPWVDGGQYTIDITLDGNEPSAADFRLGPDDIAQHQVRLVETHSPWKELTLRWGRNYQPLTTVAGSVEDNSPEEAARLREEWRERRGTQDVDDYPLAEHVERNSALQTSAGATAERDRLLALRSVRREVWAIEAFTPPVEVGMAIEVEHPLLAGRVGRIISVSRSPTHDTTELEVWL